MHDETNVNAPATVVNRNSMSFNHQLMNYQGISKDGDSKDPLYQPFFKPDYKLFLSTQ